MKIKSRKDVQKNQEEINKELKLSFNAVDAAGSINQENVQHSERNATSGKFSVGMLSESTKG